MTAQIAAGIIFIAMFLLIVLEIFERHIITLGSAALILVVVFGFIMRSPEAIIQTLNFKSVAQLNFWYGEAEEVVSGVNWSTIIFIFGMMIMVEGMGRSGFFRWICLGIAELVKYKNIPLLICFMVMAGVLSMFIDSITVILFLAAVTVELAKMLKFNPIPMIISEIFCANLGGTATMCGDPPNIIIGTSLGYTFFDFITNTGLIVAVCAPIVILFFYLCFKKELKESERKRDGNISIEKPRSAIKNKAAFYASVIVFAIVVILLITHAQTTLSVAAIGCIAAVLTIAATLLTSGTEDIKYIFSKLDYKTLLFFIGLFISVGGLERTGVLEMIAELIKTVSGGNVTMIIVIILWMSAIASAFVDNIPFAATMVPVISIISKQGVNLDVLAWTLSIGTDIGGNATPIGASANVVGTSVAAKEGHPISWGKYCKYCVPATIIVLTISMICIFIRYQLGG